LRNAALKAGRKELKAM